MDVQIEQATDYHLGALVGLTANRQIESQREGVPTTPIDERRVAAVLTQAMAQGMSYVATNQEGAVIGGLVLIPSSDWWCPRAVFLTDLLFHVPKDYRQGAVGLLTAQAKAVSNHHGLPLRIVNQHSENLEEVSAFLTRRDFVSVGGSWTYLPKSLKAAMPQEAKEAAA